MNLNKNDSSTIGIIANDAGAANLILWLIKNYNNYSYRYCLQGPAIKIFEDNLTYFNNLSFDQIFSGIDFIITGTSLYSDLEYIAREKAAKENIFNAAVVDHWVNYEIRFIRNNRMVLPDEIWVFDSAAFKKAKFVFENILIRQYPNFYVNELANKIKSKKINKLNNHKKVLYVLEPLRQNWLKNQAFGEIEVLDFFLENISKLDQTNSFDIKLRPHPSHKFGKFEDWVNNNQLFKISIDYENSLEDCIAWADIVIGCETFALVIAEAAEKRCITSIPPYGPDCRLKINKLEYLRDLKVN
tara:strand:- start:4184 stop:5083 length:900 start_codon:yes stop_codon:yes gene_type:complete